MHNYFLLDEATSEMTRGRSEEVAARQHVRVYWQMNEVSQLAAGGMSKTAEETSYTVKKVPSPPGMSLTKLFLTGIAI